jgi:WD40 repeat protein
LPLVGVQHSASKTKSKQKSEQEEERAIMSLFGAASNTFGSGTSLGLNTGMNSQAAAPDKDIEVAQPPSDSISALSFSPQAEFLAVSSWDNNVGELVEVAQDAPLTGIRLAYSASMEWKQTGARQARHLTAMKGQCWM